MESWEQKGEEGQFAFYTGGLKKGDWILAFNQADSASNTTTDKSSRCVLQPSDLINPSSASMKDLGISKVHLQPHLDIYLRRAMTSGQACQKSKGDAVGARFR